MTENDEALGAARKSALLIVAGVIIERRLGWSCDRDIDENENENERMTANRGRDHPPIVWIEEFGSVSARDSLHSIECDQGIDRFTRT